MSVAQHAREFPPIWCLFPDVGEAGGDVDLLRALCALLVKAMCSHFERSVSGYREDLDTLLVERSVILRALGAALLKGVHVPVVTGEASAVVEELEVRSETATKLDCVASVVDVEKSVDLGGRRIIRSEEHTSELQSHLNLVCRLSLDKK